MYHISALLCLSVILERSAGKGHASRTRGGHDLWVRTMSIPEAPQWGPERVKGPFCGASAAQRGPCG